MSLASNIAGAATAAPALDFADAVGSGISFQDVSVSYGATTVLDKLTLAW